jgi:hypothetical protein
VSAPPGQREISPRGPPKIFGIGLSRTGTMSLHLALGLFGFRSLQYPPLERPHDLLEYHDAAVDTPVACMFHQLDALYPGSRFILTVREVHSWLDSTQAFFRPSAAARRVAARGAPQDLRHAAMGSWHIPAQLPAPRGRRRAPFCRSTGATAYARYRRRRGWGKLCKFLRKPVPALPFPHANRRREAEQPQPALVDVAARKSASASGN